MKPKLLVGQRQYEETNRRFYRGVTAPAGKRMGHAGALISGGADTAEAKLAVMKNVGSPLLAIHPRWDAY